MLLLLTTLFIGVFIFVDNSLHLVLLQELIQNAEDAGAKRIIFLIDHSTYGTDPNQLYDPRLAIFQV